MGLKDIVESVEAEKRTPPKPVNRPSLAASSTTAAKRGRPRKDVAEPLENSRAKARVGKRALVGHFSPEMHKEVNRLAFDLDMTLQALIGEALDDILIKNKRHAFGER